LPIVDGRDIRFARPSTADGLTPTKVTHIVQDDQGFMWFGNQYGLNRFDGYNFKVFVHDPRNPNSLSGVFISALFKDRDGALWVGCDQFLNKFNRATETFTRYPVPFVKHISQDAAGMLWLATGTGLYGLDPATGRIRHYSHDPNDPSSLSSNDVKSSGEDKEGKFWVANSESLDEFDRMAGKVRLHIPLDEPSSEVPFYEDRFGVFWIFDAFRKGLAVFDRKTNTLTHYSFHELEPPSTALTVMAMIEDQNGTLWLATHGAGLLKFDREHRRLIGYRNNPGDPDSLPEDNVENLFADREGNIWAGLGRMGVTHFATKPLPFNRIPHLRSSDGTAEPFVGAVYEDRQGILWIGTPEALNRIDRKAGHYTSYNRTAGPAASTDAITIVEDRSGNLWVGTYGHGLLRFERRTGQFQTYLHNPADPYSLSNDIVSRLLVDHNGTLWAATSDGLNRFDAATGRFTVYKLDPQRKTVSYLELVEDRKGTLWLGTDSSGLHRVDPATGHFTKYEHDMNRPGTLSDNRVNSVYFDHSGTMWVGTQNGLDTFDAKTGTFTVYTRRDGLPGNAVGRILEDDHGDLWLSTNNGVARFDRQSRIFKNYSTADGLPGPDLIGWGAGFKSSSGEMFFGGFNGATAFFPNNVVDSSYTPPIVLTDFRLFGNPVEIGARSPLKKSISYANDVILSHEQNILSLTFAALSYSNAMTNRYRYKLEGLERDWNEVGSDRRQATYTTLPTGRYTFRAQGATSGGGWSEPGVALNIEILPAWYRTNWFLLLCVTVTGVVCWVAFKWHIRRVAARLDAQFQERLAERTRVAQDLHDTLLQGFISASMQLSVANRQLPSDWPAKPIVSDVLGLMKQVIDEGRNAVRGMRLSAGDSDDLERAFSRIRQELVVQPTTSFRIVVEGGVRPLHPLVRDDVYRIGREALINAFRHSRAAAIEVELGYMDRQLRVIVRDNGCGIDPQVLSSGRDGHWGLPGMRERAARMGARLKTWSRATGGTEVELSVPGHIAFRLDSSHRWLRWLARFGPRKGGDDVHERGNER
jgi:ligand-binding sensor domain-containing protein/signal transduction histidine kinase